MAVYERAYHPYAGPLTPTRARYMVIPRYVYSQVFRSKLFTAFFALSFIPTIVFALTIYLHHNLTALALLKIPETALAPIVKEFFLVYVSIQGGLAFLIALFVGPALVSPDLTHNGLALYLSRPFSRTEYVFGKLLVLVILMSSITWVPGLLLFLLQSYLQGTAWMGANLRIAGAIFAAHWTYILTLSLMALACSAWVKRKPLAGGLMMGTFFVSGGLAGAINGILRTSNGDLINLGGLLSTVTARLFGVEPPTKLSLASSMISLAVLCLLCLGLLARKIRAYEVVR